MPSNNSFSPFLGGGGVLNNFTAVIDPNVNDDSTAGYSVGSQWVNLATDEAWILVDSTAGAAVWVSTTAAGGGGATVLPVSAAGPVTVGDILALAADGVVKADATLANDNWRVVGIALASAAAGMTVSVELGHALANVRIAPVPAALSNREAIWISTTPGSGSLVPASAAGQVEYRVGYLQGADGILTSVPTVFDPQFYVINP